MSTWTEQPMPVPNEQPSIQGLVRADLERREQVGIQRYGTPLQPFNGRDPLMDAYEEALDLACYLKQAMAERDQLVPRHVGQAPPLSLPDLCAELGIDPAGRSEAELVGLVEEKSQVLREATEARLQRAAEEADRVFGPRLDQRDDRQASGGAVGD